MADKYEDAVSGVAVVVPVRGPNVAYNTMATTGIGTPTSVAVTYALDGEDLIIEGSMVTGTATAANVLFTLPNSYAVDFTKRGNNFRIGDCSVQGAAVYAMAAISTNPNQFYVVATNDISVPAVGNVAIGTGNRLSFNARIPITALTGSAVVAYGAGQATAVTLGLVKDRKEYVSGTAYTNGTPSVTGSVGTSVTVRAILVPYQTVDGAWRLTFNVVTSFTSASVSGVTFTFTGVTFKNISNFLQPCNSLFGGPTIGTPTQCYATNNTGQIIALQTTGSATNLAAISGDVELDSKPTWAD